MKLFTLKYLFLTTVFMLFGCLSIQASDDDLITEQITIKLDKAGTLPNKIESTLIPQHFDLTLFISS